MIIRPYGESDLEEIKRIHEKFFSDQFTFDDFCRCFGSLVAEENGKIISVMNLRLLVEMTSVSDKDLPTNLRREAMIRLLSKALLISGQNGYDSIHAFIHDDVWASHLKKKYGFRDTSGKSLVIG